jgi:SAM-dependent methyltransferase
VAFANHLLESGEDVYIYGFDFLEPTRQHHFGDTQERGTVHRTDLEWLWFRQCIHKGIIHQFGWNPAREGIPAVRRPVPCGNDQAPLAGREPCQLGWYKRVAALLAPGTRILDVGAGSGRGVQVLREHGMQAEGLEPDERAPDFPGRVRTPLEEIPDKAYAAVCAVDVMEHVFYDLDFLRHLMRISSGEVFVTMPNFTRSRAANTHHAREYTIAQAWNALEPGWVYVASPDGEAHFTLLLRRTPSGRAMDFSPQGPGNAVGNPPLLVEDDVIPPGRRFNNTVDGQEWPHFLCVWGG